MKSVQLIISRGNNNKLSVERIIEVANKHRDEDCVTVASLKFLNEYINRDKVKPYIHHYDDLPQAKKVSGLSIKGKLLKQ